MNQQNNPPYVFFNSQCLHPIVYHSRSFQGSQRNWSAVQKEAAAIHRAVLRIAFYLTDSDVIVHSDHKPLAKFIEATTANTRVNDWSFQINAICRTLQFKFINGSDNKLADAISRLRYNELYEEKEPEKSGHEFGKPMSKQEESTNLTDDEVQFNVFMMTLNPIGDAKKELDRLHSELIKNVDQTEVLKEQKKDYATIFKALERKGDKFTHVFDRIRWTT